MLRNIVLDYPNVNGVLLSLKISTRQGPPASKQFTISFSNNSKGLSWTKIYVIVVTVINIITFCYSEISLTAVSIILTVFLSLLLFWFTHSVQSETLTVIPTVGIQSSVKYVYGKEDNFITWSCIDDVIIREVIKFNQVLYYLTILVKVNREDSDSYIYEDHNLKLIPLFKYTKPRRRMLERIYSEVRDLLTERLPPGAMGAGDVS